MGGGLGVALAVVGIGGGLAAGLVLVHSTPVAEWSLVLGGFLARAATGRLRWRSGSPASGRLDAVDLPAALRRRRTRVVGIRVLDREAAVVLDGGWAIGVLRAGPRRRSS